MKRARFRHRESASAAAAPAAAWSAGLRWIVSPELKASPDELARAAGGPAGAAGAATVKRSGVRRVRLIDLPALGTPVAFKEYFPRGPGAILRCLLRGHPAAREWRALRRLRDAGVAVPAPLAVGLPALRRLPIGPGCLALEAVACAATLEDVLLKKAPAPLSRRELAARLGVLVRSMHDAGVVHPDLHAANILVTPGGALYLIDFHSARLAQGPARRRARRRDLASLAGAFLVRGRRTDRLRFFKAYFGEAHGRGDLKRAARWVEAAAWERLQRSLSRYDSRPLREGRTFRRIEAPAGWTGMSECTERAKRLARLLFPDPVVALARAKAPLKIDKAAEVHRLTGGDDRCIVKIYRRRKAIDALRALVGRSRARRAWFNGFRLLHRGLATARPILFAARRAPGDGAASLIVFEEAAGSTTLDRFMADAGSKTRRRMIARVAGLVARMHSFFLTNRDLKAQNILVDPDGAPMIIDPDGVAAARRVRIDAAARDLMRLNASFPDHGPVTNADRMRFWARYARARALDPAAAARLRSRTIRLTRAKWNKWNRRSR